MLGTMLGTMLGSILCIGDMLGVELGTCEGATNEKSLPPHSQHAS